MKLNEGTVDRIIRVVAGIALLVLAFTVIQGGWAIAAGIVGGVLLLTGAIGFCPLYRIFGLSTCPVNAR